MATFHGLVEGVAARARFTGPEEVPEATGAVLGSLVRLVPEPDGDGDRNAGAAPGRSGPESARLVLEEITRLLACSHARARHLVRVVLAELRRRDGEVVARMAAGLPVGTVAALCGDDDARDGPRGP